MWSPRSDMPVYTYKGVSEAGKAIRGFVDAESDRSARAKLRRDGVFLTDLSVSTGSEARRSDAPPRRFSFDMLRRVGGADLAIATRQLATLIGAGIPLVEALGALTEQVESPRLKSAISGIRERVNEGASLADALSMTSLFGDLYVSMCGPVKPAARSSRSWSGWPTTSRARCAPATRWCRS